MSATAEELERLAHARAEHARRRAEEKANARTWTCGRRKAPCDVHVILYVHVQPGCASHICRGEEIPLHQTSGPTGPRKDTR